MSPNTKQKAEIQRIKESVHNALYWMNLVLKETLARLEKLESGNAPEPKQNDWDKEVQKW